MCEHEELMAALSSTAPCLALTWCGGGAAATAAWRGSCPRTPAPRGSASPGRAAPARGTAAAARSSARTASPTHSRSAAQQTRYILLLILKTLDCIHIIHISVPDNDTQDNPQLSAGLYLNFIHTWRTILFLRTLLTRSSSEMKSCWSSHSRPGMNCISLTLTLYIVASEAEYLNGLLS